MGLGTSEILIIILGIILLFGGKGLPGLARRLGKSLREFQNATRDIKEEVKSVSESFEEASEEINDTLNRSIKDKSNSSKN